MSHIGTLHWEFRSDQVDEEMKVTWPGSIATFRGVDFFIQAVIKEETFYTFARVGGGKVNADQYCLAMRSTENNDLRHALKIFPCKEDIFLGQDVEGMRLDDPRLEIVAGNSWRFNQVRVNYDLGIKVKL